MRENESEKVSAFLGNCDKGEKDESIKKEEEQNSAGTEVNNVSCWFSQSF